MKVNDRMATYTREAQEITAAGEAGGFFGELNYIIRAATEANHSRNEMIKEFDTTAEDWTAII